MKSNHARSAHLACALLLLVCATPALARKPRVHDESFLQPTERTAMAGKTVAIAVGREAPHTRFVDGDFWRAGVAGAVGVVNPPHRFNDFGSMDPMPVAEALLSDLLRDAYGMRVLPLDDRMALNDKPKYLAQRFPEADYVLSVTGMTSHGEFLAGKRGRAAVGMTVRLVNVATQYEVAYYSCAEMTPKSENNPSLSELESDNGRRIKQTLLVLAAKCARNFASQRLGASDEKLAAFPKWNQDPFAPWTPPAATAPAPAAATQ